MRPVNSGAVNTSGNILELGPLQANGTLAAAPPGISSTGGKGESGSLNMTVAKSGRTTGLTCASISALNLDVEVDYFTDCAETKPYLTKTYTNQIGDQRATSSAMRATPDRWWWTARTPSRWGCFLPAE